MRGNSGGMYSDTVAMSLRGGMKGACIHVSTPTLKSVWKRRYSV